MSEEEKGEAKRGETRFFSLKKKKKKETKGIKIDTWEAEQ